MLFERLVVIESKETEFHKRVVELLNHFTNYQIKVINFFKYNFYFIVNLCQSY